MSLDASLRNEWQKKINSSPEVKQAKRSLEFHRRKMKQLQEELTSAEVWEKELEERLMKVEEKVQPVLMKFCNQLENEDFVDDIIIDEAIAENQWEKLEIILKKKISRVEEMERSKLVGLVKTVLSTRNCLVDRDNQEGVDVMQEMARTILKQMGRSTIDWIGMREWEVRSVRMVMKEVEGVPVFVTRIVDQLLGRLEDEQSF